MTIRLILMHLLCKQAMGTYSVNQTIPHTIRMSWKSLNDVSYILNELEARKSFFLYLYF